MVHMVSTRDVAVLRARPEWSVVAVALTAWVGWCLPMRPAPEVGGHAEHTGAQAVSIGVVVGYGCMWLLMAAAMMLPSTIPSVRYVAFTSQRRRRQRAIGMFVVGYLAVWSVFGLLVLPLTLPAAEYRWIGVIALTLAGLYELTPIKRAALRRCHRTQPIRFTGPAADRSCLGFGVYQGKTCIASCGPAMFAVLLLGHPLVISLVVGAFLFVERIAVRPDHLRRFAGYVGIFFPIAILLALG